MNKIQIYAQDDEKLVELKNDYMDFYTEYNALSREIARNRKLQQECETTEDVKKYFKIINLILTKRKKEIHCANKAQDKINLFLGKTIKERKMKPVRRVKRPKDPSQTKYYVRHEGIWYGPYVNEKHMYDIHNNIIRPLDSKIMRNWLNRY